MHFFHSAHSKANTGVEFLTTGGSWKKSPVMTSWIPPKGSLFFLKCSAILQMRVNSGPSTMETSSMMRTWRVVKPQPGTKHVSAPWFLSIAGEQVCIFLCC
ncbi:hypothetical protein FB45DRAFT_740024 [Roridomyces roridus]|uniref:Uncharacterized protein n=1 Tax=Roridomyces roridus TaxID=1738132 RepID=A0AAD7C5D0_9AGAR|nr:hypothetical protein FB45DRAFT_740024 [Roridomyces roridus]